MILSIRALPAFANSDVEAFVDEFDLGSHHPAHQDVSDPVVDRILKRHPAFLDEVALHAQLGGDRGDLTRVIRLHAADGHQGVGVRCNRIGNDVFQLANLVAAEREPGVAVVAFRIELDTAAQMLRKPVELLDRRRPEHERVAFESLQHRGAPDGLSEGGLDHTNEAREGGRRVRCARMMARRASFMRIVSSPVGGSEHAAAPLPEMRIGITLRAESPPIRPVVAGVPTPRLEKSHPAAIPCRAAGVSGDPCRLDPHCACPREVQAWVRRRRRFERLRGAGSRRAPVAGRTPRAPCRALRTPAQESTHAPGEGRTHDHHVIAETPQGADFDGAAEGRLTPSERHGVRDREQDDPNLVRREQVRETPAGPGPSDAGARFGEARLQERLDLLCLRVARRVLARGADHEVALAIDLPLAVRGVGEERPARNEQCRAREGGGEKGAPAGAPFEVWRFAQLRNLSNTSRFRTAVTM